MTDTYREVMAQRRQEIARDLTQLRGVLRDLEGNGISPEASFETRQAHFVTIQAAKDRIHELNVEYVKLATAK